ncbi:MAG: DNA topoisomerase IB [Gemmatimonadota bacterium]|nr:DNA topoisomerase IB [Gemmatimonadota bacterium]MDH3479124.1 DNA topoisomerase IB [Gemmatimonadota bacterium]MDH3571738.1 DNA topoisomerase IB [Gemmatimonadota bacterium]
MSRAASSGASGRTPRRAERPRTAAPGGLLYVSDAEPGISRKRAGRGFSYIGLDGEPIRDRAERRRIRSLVIPPAWTDVWICPAPNGHLQATGRDAKGRKQYRYHPRYREVRDDTKFDRMLAFSNVLPAIRERVERDLARDGLPRDKVLATVVRLLEKTLIRIGSDVYARENRSYGLTTMRRRHVEVSGSKLWFEFRGKSGVMRSVAITDRRIASIVQHCQTLPGQELFQYLDDRGRRQKIDSGDINAYLRQISGQEFTAKDFRTWAGTIAAATTLRDMGPATTQRETQANIIKAIDLVAARLGNTRAVCRKYYVHPRVIEAYRDGIVAPKPARPRSQKRRHRRGELRRGEIVVLKLLHLEPNRRTPKAKAPTG